MTLKWVIFFDFSFRGSTSDVKSSKTAVSMTQTGDTEESANRNSVIPPLQPHLGSNGGIIPLLQPIQVLLLPLTHFPLFTFILVFPH